MKWHFFKTKNQVWYDLWVILFRFSFVTFVMLYAVDYAVPGFVTNWFNPVWLLISTIIFGILVAVTDRIKI